MLAYDADLELFRDNFKRFMRNTLHLIMKMGNVKAFMPRSVWTLLGENGFVCRCARRIWWLWRTNPLFIDAG